MELTTARLERLVRENEELRRENEDLRRSQSAAEADRRTFETILDNLPVSVSLVDTEGNYVFVNRHEAARWGYEPADAIGRPIHEFLPPDTAYLAGQQDARVRETGKPVPFFEENVINGDRQRVMLIGKCPINDLEGRVTGVCMMALDITQRKNAEELLAESDRSYRASLELFPDPVIVTAENTIVYANRAASIVFGGSAEHDLIGIMSIDLLHPDEHTRLLDIRNQVKNGTRRIPLSVFRFLRLSGEEFTGEGSSTQITWGSAPASLVNIRDITDRLASDTALRQRETELERSNNELEQFAYLASHDMQEPLRAIGGFCDLLQLRYADKLDEEGREFIAYAIDGARRMRGLIDDLLTYSKVGRSEITRTPVPLAAVLEEVQGRLRSAIKDENAEIILGELPTVDGDRTLLTQLMQNLVGNAIKFHDGAAPRVWVSAERDRDFWVISVGDNGIGIEPQYTDKVFQMFQRLHSRGKYAGNGLGLALCQRVVDRHGGKISIEPNEPRGTIIKFTLPL